GPRRSVFGERVTRALLLETERLESVPRRRQLPLRVQQHQIHDAFPRTPRYGRAADVLHDDTGQVRSNACCDMLGDHGGPGVVVPAKGLSVLIGFDDWLDLDHGCVPQLVVLGCRCRMRIYHSNGISLVRAGAGAEYVEPPG